MSSTSTQKRLAFSLEVSLCYFKNKEDFPLRLIVTPSGFFESSGKDCDYVLNYDPSYFGISEGSSAQEILEDPGGSPFGPKFTLPMVLYYDSKTMEKNSASLAVNVSCSESNDFERRCWSEGGACHFSLFELMANRILEERQQQQNHLYLTRKVYNSAFNVDDGKRLICLVKFRLGTFGSLEKSRGQEGRCLKWRDVTHFGKPDDGNTRYFTLSERVSKATLTSPIQVVSEVLPLESAPSRLYGLTLKLPDSVSEVLKTMCVGLDQQEMLRLRWKKVESVGGQGSSFSNYGIHSKEEEEDSFRTDISKEVARYERILKLQEERVPYDSRTKRMRCPWCPMDICVWRTFSDYNCGMYVKLDEGNLIGVKEGNLKLHVTIMNGKTKQPQTRIGGGGYSHKVGHRNQHEERQSSWKSRIMEEAVEENSNRIYLPFFSYLMCQELCVHKGYWGEALRILCERKNTTVERYETKWDALPPKTKASDAFQMICNFTQMLEYIPDYYRPLEKPRSRNQHQKKQQQQRDEVEQFWDSLRALCGDCDDLALGHAQMYKAFVETSRNQRRVDETIRDSKVLREMRDMLSKNYILLFNIEAVFLPKQGFSTEIESEEGDNGVRRVDGQRTSDSYRGVTEEEAYGDFERDTKNMNSAHADVKLIPKLYFERCVNRGCSSIFKTPEGVPFSSIDDQKSQASCCWYHRFKPDTFNDQLPVLFGEGTSMLICNDETPPTSNVPWFEKALFQDPQISEVAKSPIFAKVGKSGFYKAPLFGCTLDFLESHGVATFSYARPQEGWLSTRNQHTPGKGQGQGQYSFVIANHHPFGESLLDIARRMMNGFSGGGTERSDNIGGLGATTPVRNHAGVLRGVSHHQMSYKCEKVMLIPYGLPITDITPNQKSGCCSGVRFPVVEVSPELLHMCRSATDFRVRPKKLSKPVHIVPPPAKPTSGHRLCNLIVPYNMITSDTGPGNLETTRELLEGFTTVMNQTFDRRRSAEELESHEPPNKEYFIMTMDNHYVTTGRLNRIRSLLVDAISGDNYSRGKHYHHGDNSANPRRVRNFRTSFALEEYSSDVRIWRLKFEFEPMTEV